MFNRINMKKIISILAVVMVTSFALAAVIFVSEYGKNGFAALQNSVRPANAVDVNEEKTEPLSGIKNIKVSTSSHDITFIPTDTNEVKAHFHGYYKSSNKDYKPELTVVSAGDELTIKVTYKPTVGTFSYSGDLKLDIYLPRTYSDNLQVNTSSAEISIQELNLNSFICKTTSGDLEARLVNAKKAELGASSGNFKINGKYDSITFNSTSGDFSTDGITAGNAALKTSSGNIKGDISADNILLGSTSGDMTMSSINAKKCIVNTSSGRVILRDITGEVEATATSGDITLEFKEFMNNIKIATSSGSTEIKLPPDPEFALSYKTSSGSGKCDFPITITGTQARNNLEGIVTSDRNSITVASSSGDMTISGK